MSARKPIAVVCGVICDAEHRLLVAQRPLHKHLGGKWEFAGGKVELGEDPRAALQRDYGNVLIEMLPFVCRLAQGSPAPHPHEHIALRWVTLEELRSLDLAPADWPVIDAYARQHGAG